MKIKLFILMFSFLVMHKLSALHPLVIDKQGMSATQEVKEPVLVVTGNDTGTDGSTWFKGNGTYVYRLCTYWDGPWGGLESTELFRQRGSIRGLAVGEQLQFYISSASGSVTGSDDNAAVTVPIGDGLCETVYKYPGGVYTNRDEPSSGLPPSAFANAWLTRTVTGALLVIDGVPGAHCGEESLYFNSTSPSIRITISNAELAAWDRLEKTVSDSGPGSAGNGTYAYSLTVTASLPDQGEVELNGCSELGVGKESVVTAKATKESGTYRFWVEPQKIMTIESSGSSANLRGSSPGRGILYVEYTNTDGKKVQASKVATCVQVESYNGGQAIPQIALYDINGNKQSGKVTIPYTAEPGEANELVDFVFGNPSVSFAVASAYNIDIQGLKVGKTTLEARDNCGNTTGPAVEVEVVNCDEETIATLERMMKAAKEGQKDAYQAIERIVGNKEFEELDTKIAESTGNLAIKTAGLIVGTLAGGTTAGAGVETAAGIYGKASNVRDILQGGDVLSQASNLSQLIVELGGSAIQQAIAGSIETLQAANEFGQDLGKMIGANRALQSATKEAEQSNKVVEDLVNRQKLCRKSPQTPPGKQEPSTGPQKNPTEPKPGPQKKPTEPKTGSTEPTAQTQKQPVQEPQPEEPTVEDEILIDPERPTVPPRQVGLPYDASDCGCKSSEGLVANQAGLSKLQLGLENLGGCVETFSKGPLTEYVKTLEGLESVYQILEAAITTGPEALKKAAKETAPRIEILLESTKSFEVAGKKFLVEFEKCPESVSTGMEVLKSSEKVTVDSIKTHY